MEWSTNADMFVVAYGPFLPNDVVVEPVTVNGQRGLHIVDNRQLVLARAFPVANSNRWHLTAWAVEDPEDKELAALALAVQSMDETSALVSIDISPMEAGQTKGQIPYSRIPHQRLWEALDVELTNARRICDTAEISHKTVGLRIESLQLSRDTVLATGQWHGHPLEFTYRYESATLLVGTSERSALWSANHLGARRNNSQPVTAKEFRKMFLDCARDLHRAPFQYLFASNLDSLHLVPGVGQSVEAAYENALTTAFMLGEASGHQSPPVLDPTPVLEDPRVFPDSAPDFSVQV